MVKMLKIIYDKFDSFVNTLYKYHWLYSQNLKLLILVLANFYTDFFIIFAYYFFVIFVYYFFVIYFGQVFSQSLNNCCILCEYWSYDTSLKDCIFFYAIPLCYWGLRRIGEGGV